MLELDGKDAGGQFVRTALALSVLDDTPIRLRNIRGGRSTPGLRPQHVAVIEVLSAITDASVSGNDVGSESVEFEPGEADDWTAGGIYSVDVGTAGSLTLLFDAVLPLATRLKSPLSVTATGGTDVKWAPPADYYARVKLPTVRRFGLGAAFEVHRRGFYPDGGGEATLHLWPSDLERIDHTARGELVGVDLYSTQSRSLADADVAARQVDGALETLGESRELGDSFEATTLVETTVASDSPGSAIVIRLEHGTGYAGVSALGERGKPAETVGREAATDLLEPLDSPSPVDVHLADQLLVFLALAGGRLRLPEITDHVTTSLDLLEAFGYEGRFESEANGGVVTV